GAHLRGPQRHARRRRRAPPAGLLAAPRRRRPRGHHRGLRRPQLRRRRRPDARPRLNTEEDVMPLRRLLLVLGAAMLGLLPLTYPVESLTPLRVPALLGLVLTLGLWALALIAGDAPRTPDEADAETMMRERRPGWENLPRDFREQWEERERIREQ